jgi:hypothetical protein
MDTFSDTNGNHAACFHKICRLARGAIETPANNSQSVFTCTRARHSARARLGPRGRLEFALDGGPAPPGLPSWKAGGELDGARLDLEVILVEPRDRYV